MSMTWMFRRDPPLHVRQRVGREVGNFIERFCQNADRRAMRIREEAFLAALSDWAFYALGNNKTQAAQFLKELERLIKPSDKTKLAELPDPPEITESVRDDILSQSREWRRAFSEKTSGMTAITAEDMRARAR